MLLALTHGPSPQMAECELTHLRREPIDLEHARRQHLDYCQMLRECGAEVRTLDIHPHQPDGVFIEDTAIVLDEVAVLASMGAESRRAEPAGIEPELRKYREVKRIEYPATIEGGDVLRVGRNLLVGLSSRTNFTGVQELEVMVRAHGYRVTPMPVRGSLHLKSVCTVLPDGRLLVNVDGMEPGAFAGMDHVTVPWEEPAAANVALVNGTVCVAAAYPRTADMLRDLGFRVRTVELSEFAKAEGAVTCMSLLFEAE